MSLVRNERAKLTATYFNNLAVALFVVGALTPLASSLEARTLPTELAIVLGVVCIGGSIGLDVGARRLLRRLVE